VQELKIRANCSFLFILLKVSLMQEDFYYIAAIYSTKKVEIYMNNSEIHQTYNRLWSQALQSIQTNSLRLDSNLLNKPGDSRRGFTLICRPSQRVQHSVMEFLKEAQQIEPNQYYYKSTELHTTVLSIITCNADFKLSEIDIAPYVEVLHQSIKSISSFNISYRGITASPDSVMNKGSLMIRIWKSCDKISERILGNLVLKALWINGIRRIRHI